MTAQDNPRSFGDAEGQACLLIAEVADILRVNTSSVRRWIRAGRLRAIRPAGSRGTIRIPRAELERLLKADDPPTSSKVWLPAR